MANKVLADYQNEVDSLVQDRAADLQAPDRDKAIDHAIERFSQARPRIVVADVTGTGGSDYTPPSGWIEQFSTIRQVEYPTGNVPATLIEDGDFEVYRTTTAEKIRLLKAKPLASENFRVTFPGLHSVTASAGTIGDGDFRAVCHLAASIACQMLANMYSQTSDPTIQADSVEHKSKAFEFSQRARDLLKVYREHIGAERDSPPPAASVTGDFDRDLVPGIEPLTHPHKWR
jgi:hypothetical protein